MDNVRQFTEMLYILNQVHIITILQHCKEGDGYQRKAPHTYNELFEGLNILDAAKVCITM